MSAERFATTPVKEIGREDPTGTVEVSISAWGKYHDVFEWLLPTQNRVQVPRDVIGRIGEYLDGTYATQETFTKKQLGLDQHGNNVIRKLFRLFRITRFDTSTKPYRYRNPRYDHYEARTIPIDADERDEWWQAWRDIITIDTEFVAHHWGVGESAVAKWVDKNTDMTLTAQYQQNKRQFARTVHTNKVWTGESVRAFVAPLPLNYHTVKNWLTKYVTESEWQPPERPTDKTWFDQTPDR